MAFDVQPTERGGPAVVDMADPGYWQDPHSVLRAARARHPLALTPGGAPIVLRYADVESLAADPRLVSNALGFVTTHTAEGPLAEWWRRMLTNLNGPEHVRLRSLVSRAFTPRAVDRMRPRVRELAKDLIARRAEAGTLDVVEHLADELPIRVICEMLGVEGVQHADYARWSGVLGAVLSPLASEAQRAADEADEPVAPGDLRTLVINLLFGGHDTSRSTLTIAVALLVAHPEAQARLRSDPALVPSAVEEMLRVEPIIQAMSRAPLEDLEVAGVKLAAGRPVTLSILAANRDPEAFEDPDAFDVTRRGPRSFTFGWGLHHCLGAALARAELQEMIPVLLDQCHELELAGEPPRWVPYAPIRRLESLVVRFRGSQLAP